LKDSKLDHLDKVMCKSFTAMCSDGKPMHDWAYDN